MKENLMIYEDNIENYVRNNFKAESEGLTVIQHRCQEIFSENPTQTDIVNDYCSSRLFGLSKNQIVGSVIAEENFTDYRVMADSEGQATLRVIEMRSRITDSFATGTTNLAIPQQAYTGCRIYEQDVPKGTKLYDFFDFENKYKSGSHPRYPGQPDAEPAYTRGVQDKKYSEGIKVIREEQAESNQYSDDEYSFRGKTEGDAQGKLTEENVALKAFNNFCYRESHYFLKIAVSNTMDRNIGMAIRIKPVEGKAEPNLYYPRAQMNFNVKIDKIDQPVVYLMKKDASKPFGDFLIEVIFSTLRDYEVSFSSNLLMFNDSTQPIVFEVCKAAIRRPPRATGADGSPCDDTDTKSSLQAEESKDRSEADSTHLTDSKQSAEQGPL